MDLTLPSIIYGFAIATLVGAGFHLLRGGNLGRLLLYLLLAWIGFWAGHFLGSYFGLSFGSIGPLYAGTGVVLSLLVVFGGSKLFDFSKLQ